MKVQMDDGIDRIKNELKDIDDIINKVSYVVKLLCMDYYPKYVVAAGKDVDWEKRFVESYVSTRDKNNVNDRRSAKIQPGNFSDFDLQACLKVISYNAYWSEHNSGNKTPTSWCIASIYNIDGKGLKQMTRSKKVDDSDSFYNFLSVRNQFQGHPIILITIEDYKKVGCVANYINFVTATREFVEMLSQMDVDNEDYHLRVKIIMENVHRFSQCLGYNIKPWAVDAYLHRPNKTPRNVRHNLAETRKDTTEPHDEKEELNYTDKKRKHSVIIPIGVIFCILIIIFDILYFMIASWSATWVILPTIILVGIILSIVLYLNKKAK